MIKNNTISGIKFTDKEIQVISCFTSNLTKSKAIGKILGSHTKTIDTHITNIKSKIKANDKDEIAFFVRKSDEFHALKHFFNLQYIDSFYRDVAKKIAYHLKMINVVCYFYATPKLTNQATAKHISDSLTLAGIQVTTFDDIKSFHVNPAEQPQTFCLLVTQNMDELQLLQPYISNLATDCLLICLDEASTIPSSFSNNISEILFFKNTHNKDFYQYIIQYLAKRFKVIHNLVKDDKILTAINNIEKNIHSDLPIGDLNRDATYPAKSSQDSLTSARSWALSFATIIILGIFVTIWGLQSPTKPGQTITSVGSVGTSKLKGRGPSDILAYSLPLRNPNFTGRTSALELIRNNLHKSAVDVNMQVIAGSGGIGKTQLATEYAYCMIENKAYDAVLWITAHSQNAINDSYIDIADKLKLNINGLNQYAIKKAIHAELLEKHKVKRILFILENVVNKSDIDPYIDVLNKQWPIGIKPHVLITSRSQHWPANIVLLDVFTPEEARAFVTQQLPYAEKADIDEMIQQLHYYPLALGQAIGYIDEHTNIGDYLELYNNKKEKFLNKFSDNSGYKDTLWKTLSITLSTLNKNAKKILYISSYFESDSIPLDFFSDIPVEEKSSAIKELRKHSFVVLNNHRKSFKIHALLQEIVRLKIQNDSKWLKSAVSMAQDAAKKFDRSDTVTWGLVKQWLAHIEALTHHMPNRSEKASLLYEYGGIAAYFGVYSLAHDLYHESLETSKIVHKQSQHIHLTKALSKLGSIELKRGRYDEAKAHYQKSLHIKESFYKNDNHIALSDTLNALGEVELGLGDYEKAKYYYQRALKIKKSHYKDDNHFKLTKTLLGLGILEWKFGHYTMAAQLFHKVLDIQNKHRNQVSYFNITNTLNYIGLIEFCLGNYQNSKQYHEQALAEQKKHFQGNTNIFTTKSLQYLAIAEWALGNHHKAKELYKRVLEIKKDHYQNPKHIDIAITLQGLALTELSLGHYEKSRRLLLTDLDIRKSYYKSDNHIHMASSFHALGLNEEILGDYDSALEHIQKAYNLQYEYYRERLNAIMNVEYSPVIPWPKISTKHKRKAIAHYQKSLDIHKKLFGPDHFFVARNHYLLGQAYEMNQQPQKAIQQYNIAYDMALNAQKNINEKLVFEKHDANIQQIKFTLKRLGQKQFSNA